MGPERVNWIGNQYLSCVVPNSQTDIKTDLNTYNEHFITCLTSFQIQYYLYREVCGSQKRVNLTENHVFFANFALCLVPNLQINTKTDLHT